LALVNRAFSSIDKKLFEKSVDDLKKYIKKQLKKGFSENEIKLRVQLEGWPKELVEEVFREIK
ncbi:MAG: hypothetical protein KAU20_03295, partial [Nanoarchaeota archaeon]|nr:hypothetical protein [Nanoarchaeota archaeon]